MGVGYTLCGREVGEDILWFGKRFGGVKSEEQLLKSGIDMASAMGNPGFEFLRTWVSSGEEEVLLSRCQKVIYSSIRDLLQLYNNSWSTCEEKGVTFHENPSDLTL
jgi:hypothetical protein